MADTISPAKKYYDQANQAIDEQAILDKYNAATTAQFNVQREQNRQAENKFYNQMYNTQKTAMDTIRQSNAAAVSSGASRGVQAANELSALLGLQQESVASATELAQTNRQTAQEETAAVLENVLKAYQQAQQERAQMVQHGIEAASVDVQSEANKIAAQESEANMMQTNANVAATLVSAAENGGTAYLTALQQTGKDYSTTATPEGAASLDTALTAMLKDYPAFDVEEFRHGQDGENRAKQIKSFVETLCQSYGISDDPDVKNALDKFVNEASIGTGGNKTNARQTNDKYAAVRSAVADAYNKRLKNLKG
jgi:hypothetical protein